MKKESTTGKMLLKKVTVANFDNAQANAIKGGIDSVKTTGTDLPTCWRQCPETSRICSQTSCDVY